MINNKPLAWMGQGLLYSCFALFVGVFSTWPQYHHLPADHALIKVSFTHHGQLVSECSKRSPEELEKLPPNMRAPMNCPRQRSKVVIEVDLDGKTVYAHTAEPSGLSKDGASTAYHRLVAPAGNHRLVVRLKDSAAREGFDYVRDEVINLNPGQVLVVDFSAEKGGITFI